MTPIPRRNLLLLALAAIIAGCANFATLPAGTPSQQVQAKLGAPDSVWKNSDGSEVWEYSYGPLGRQTFMVTVGADRAVREVRQVLSEEHISKLHVGMSRDEVRRLVGRPRDISFYGLNDEEIWSWRYREWRVRTMELSAQFDRSTGTLKRISRFQVDTGGGKRR